jgi:acyl-CoA synthetase (NDP forming)
MGGSVLANLERCGFAGDMHLVSRSRPEINGRRCVPAIDDLPQGVDVAVLVIPQTAGDRRDRGLRAGAASAAAIVFASGYAEWAREGPRRSGALRAAARAPTSG